MGLGCQGSSLGACSAAWPEDALEEPDRAGVYPKVGGAGEGEELPCEWGKGRSAGRAGSESLSSSLSMFVKLPCQHGMDGQDG